MEAHDGLSAKIAEQEGFSGLWASSLTISTALGLRDNDEATWSELLSVIERIADVVAVPVLADGNTGFGNFNNARRFAKAAASCGVAGISLEDKRFPKMNSYVGDSHDLADASEFVGKLYACRDAAGEDFVLVARTEALIAGAGLSEALNRAEAYCEAGADAIFIHSRKSTFDEIARFAHEWAGRAPLVISPTSYSATPTDAFRAAGISTVIWANYALRAAFAAMRAACRAVHETGSVASVDPVVAPMRDIFDLLDYDELADAESRFLPPVA